MWEARSSEAARCGNTKRPLAHLIDSTDRQDAMNATCSIDGCGRPHKARGWCTAHYKRWMRHGDPEAPDRRRLWSSCAISGCTNPHKALSYCDAHYRRFRLYGDPQHREPLGQRFPPLGADHPGWKGDAIGYPGVHHRLTRLRGPAKSQVCCRCGGQAAAWAYDHLDADEKRDDRGYVYSTDPSHYMPMCASCHKRFDKEAAA